jgi:hypothetical protein
MPGSLVGPSIEVHMNAEQGISQWAQIVAKVWQDDRFKIRLLANPSVVLKEFGLDVPSGVQLRVVENTDRIVHLTIPAKPQDTKLSDAELEAVAGGSSPTPQQKAMAIWWKYACAPPLVPVPCPNTASESGASPSQSAGKPA